MARSTALSASAQAAYAQLLDATHAAELSRSIADLPGTFASKQVKGGTYWYYQYLDLSGRKRQLYIGPDDPRVRALIEARERGGTKPALQALAKSAVALGNAPLVPRHFKVVQRLADHGFFRAGGVLVGTHAFLAFGNMLGVRWVDAQRTQHVDLAHAGRSLLIALPSDIEIDVHGALESLRMGLLPIEHADGGTGATYLDPMDPDFQVDFLTTFHRDGPEPYRHPKLGVRLQPLKFMEYLLEAPQQAVVFSQAGSVVVNVPDPARYAMHKLVVAGERPVSRAAKSIKDIQQAAALLEVLSDLAPDSIVDAWGDITRRGPGWSKRLKSGRAALARTAQELEIDRRLPLT